MAGSEVRSALIQRGYSEGDVDAMLEKYGHLDTLNAGDLLLVVEVALIESGHKPSPGAPKISAQAADYIARNRRQAEGRKRLEGAGLL